MSVCVSFIIISHSASLVKGVCELAIQMAPDTYSEAAGGTDDDRTGTSYDLAETALEAALTAVGGKGSGVIVLTDPGSITITVEFVIDMSGEFKRARFVGTCPVEGAVVSPVRAQLGEDLDQVVDVAATLTPRADGAPAQGALRPAPAKFSRAEGESPASSMWAQGDAVAADSVGLCVRLVAVFVRLAGTSDAEVTVNEADDGSVLGLMALGITQGRGVHIETNGADATAAVAVLIDMLESATE